MKRKGKRELRRGKEGKGEGGLDLDICPRAFEFLATPLGTNSHCREAKTELVSPQNCHTTGGHARLFLSVHILTAVCIAVISLIN